MKTTDDDSFKNRRSLLRSMAAGAALIGTGVIGEAKMEAGVSGSLTNGDIAILRFLATAELIEADLWQQYAERGGVTKGDPNPYQLAFGNLDGDAQQYITSNTIDEISHANFLNAYLVLKGAEPVALDSFRVLPSSQATGARQVGRLTNLTALSIDTSWYTRYRS